MEVRELLMADEGILAGELPPAQQTGHLLPVGQLVLLLILRAPGRHGLLVLLLLLIVTSCSVVSC